MSLQNVPRAWGHQRRLSWASVFSVRASCSHSPLETLQGLSGLSSSAEGKQALRQVLTDSFTSTSRPFILASYSASASCWNCGDSKDHPLAQDGPPAHSFSPEQWNQEMPGLFIPPRRSGWEVGVVEPIRGSFRRGNANQAKRSAELPHDPLGIRALTPWRGASPPPPPTS